MPAPYTYSQYASVMGGKCQGAAQCISYNGNKFEAQAKHVLLEASHFLDSQSVKVNGLTIRSARGKQRKLTLRERFAIWLLGGKTEIRA